MLNSVWLNTSQRWFLVLWEEILFSQMIWIFIFDEKKKVCTETYMCCLPADTSLIWATSSQRNLWHLKMTKIVTNLWSPLKKYKIMLPLSPDLGPGQPKSCFRYRVQTKDLWLLLFGCSIFQRRCDRDRRIWNGRDPPSCIRQPVYTRCYTIEQQRKTPYDTMWPCIWDPHHEWPFFPPQP